MDKLVVEGGARLSGDVLIEGAKNAALPALAASLLAQDAEVVLDRVPDVVDIRTMCHLLRKLGAAVEADGPCVRILPRELANWEAPYDLVRTMRASVLVLGPLVGRYGYAKVSFPGGCAIGARPINLHLAGLEAMGARISLDGGYIEARARRLRGADIYLDMPTVTGTENLMMAAVLAEGTTIIENAAMEPEIVDLAHFLAAMGARIQGAGTERIEVQGVSRLAGARHAVIADRVEAATYAAAAAITAGDIRLCGAPRESLQAVLLKMSAAGVQAEAGDEAIRVAGPGRLRSVDIKTAPYPGFPTDVQAQFMAMMAIADGTSVIRETVFENRFMHVAELRRMGADIRVEGPTALVRGKPALRGAPVMATDLRASASLVLAGLAAAGTTEISRIYHLDRGYRALEQKLAALGARIRRKKA
ncbi:MAG: UDP-N-acetylglucosamine 1-carboxyvinyltransferase [bacterium]